MNLSENSREGLGEGTALPKTPHPFSDRLNMISAERVE
jgi:hypothetical protein